MGCPLNDDVRFECKNMILLQRAESLSGLPPEARWGRRATLIVKTWDFCKVVMAFTEKWNQRCNRHRSHANTEIEPRDSTLRADRLTDKMSDRPPRTSNSQFPCYILNLARPAVGVRSLRPQKIMNCQPALQTLQIQPYVYCLFLRYNPSGEKQSTNGEA